MTTGKISWNSPPGLLGCLPIRFGRPGIAELYLAKAGENIKDTGHKFGAPEDAGYNSAIPGKSQWRS